MSSQKELIDNILIERLKRGDKKALTEIFNKYWQSLFVSSHNLLKDKELCEEIIQDIFIDLWSNREKLLIKISLQSYLYACARYKVFGQFRKNKIKRVELFEDINKRFHYATPESKLMYQELVEQINCVVETLPDKCKTVYKLSRDEQLSHKEIAAKLNISIKTVENHITNALKVLRSSFGASLSITFLNIITQNLN